MRIAFVSLMGGSQWGGSEALWHAIAMHSLKQKDQVFVSVYDWGEPHEKIKMLKTKGAVIHFRRRYNSEAGPVEKIIRFMENRKSSLNKDYESIINFKPDAVFISQGESFDLAIHHKVLYNLLRQNKIPYSFVCHSHAQYSFIPPKEIYPGAVEIFKNAEQVFFVSQRQWKLTERRLVSKITNGYFTWNPLNMEMPSQPLQWPDIDSVKMALVGNVSDMKGHDTAFEALAKDKWRRVKWLLNIYGTGVGIDYLKELAAFYSITNKIKFHGHINDIQSIWMQNQLLLIPSAGEGLPISLVEAMACGRPAVVTDVGGNTELVIEGETGYIAASPAVDSFESTLEKAWQGRGNWKQMGIQAFRKVNSVFEQFPHIKLYKILKQQVSANNSIKPG